MGLMLTLKMLSEFEWKAQYQGGSCGVMLSRWRLPCKGSLGKLKWRSFLESHSCAKMNGKGPRHGQRM